MRNVNGIHEGVHKILTPTKVLLRIHGTSIKISPFSGGAFGAPGMLSEGLFPGQLVVFTFAKLPTLLLPYRTTSQNPNFNSYQGVVSSLMGFETEFASPLGA